MAAAKRKKSKRTSDWSWRLAGIALCAFFALGVVTGLSRSGRSLASRVETLLRMLPLTSRSALMPNLPISSISRGNTSAIALIKRTDGFYALDSDAALRGPVAPTSEGDLPIVSGASTLSASGEQLVSYVSLLVRSEATLGLTISEMRVDSDDIATLYLEYPVVQITIDISRQAPDEIARSMRILGLWRNHAEMLAAVDMTVPGQAIVRVRHAESLTAALGDQPRVASRYSKAHTPTSPEVTASR